MSMTKNSEIQSENLTTSPVLRKEIDEKMPYPDSHPRAVEIRDQKTAIDELYRNFGKHQENARKHYKNAMDSLRSMGDENQAVHSTFKEMASAMEKLKSLIDSPDFDTTT